MEHSTISQQEQEITRRRFLKQALALTSVSAGAALLAACGTPGTTPSATFATIAPTAAAVPSTATTAAVTGQSATPKIVAAANAFLATLDDTQRAGVSFPYPTGQT